MMKHTKHLLVLWVALLLGAGNAWGATYKLVTTTDDLVAGSNYIIGSAASGSAVFISTATNTNNRKQSASVTITNSEITLADDILVFELGGSTGSWTFATTNYAGTAGYLNATNTTSSNYLKIVSTDDKYNKFSISFSNNAAVITCTGKTSRNLIRYNSATSGGQLFSCYTSGQSAVYLYKEVGTSPTTPLDEPTNLSVSNVTSTTVDLSWNAVNNATGYIVTYIDASDVEKTKEVNGTTTTLDGLSASTTYRWTVTAVDNSGTYSNSSPATGSNFTTAELAKYTVNFYVEGDLKESRAQKTAGEAITLPTYAGCGDYTFAGWSTTDNHSNAPDVTGSTYTPTADTDLYAVYSKTTSGGGETSTTMTLANGTFSASDKTITWTESGKISIKQEQGESTSTPSATYISAPRWYQKHVITFTPQTTITKVVITATSNDYATDLAGSTYTNASASVSNAVVTITPTTGTDAFTVTMKAQSRISSIVIYSAGGSTTYTTRPGCDCNAPSTPLTISATPAALNLNESSNASTTLSTKGGNGGTVTYSVLPDDKGATIDGNTITFTAPGTYTVTAKQDKNGSTCAQSATVEIEVKAKPTLELIVSTPLTEFAATCMEPSAKQQITVHGFNLEDKITASLGSGSAFQLSTTGGDTDAEWSTSVDFAKDGDNRVDNKPLYIRLKSNLDGCPSSATVDRSGTITASSTHATSATQSVSGKILSPSVTVKLNDQGTNYNIPSKRLCCEITENDVKGANTNGFSTEPCEGALFSHFTLDPNNLEAKVTFPYSIKSKDALTFYAVYKKSEDGGPLVTSDTTLITSVSQLVVGEKYIMASTATAGAGKAAGTIQSGNDYLDAVDVTIQSVDGKIVMTGAGDATAFTLGGTTDNYTLTNESGQTLKAPSDAKLSFTNTNGTPTWKIADGTSSAIKITNTGYTGSTIYYNSGATRFKNYTSSSMSPVYLYVCGSGGSFTYDLTPCGPVIKGTNNIKVTSVNGAWVRSITDIAITGERLPSNVTITAKVLSGNFKLRKPATSSTGSDEETLATGHTEDTYNGTLALLYTPKAAGETSNGEIELRVYTTGGTTEHAKCTLTVQGHALPEKFVIAANTGSGWVALPNDKGATLETAGTNTAYPITVDNNGDPTKATRAPSSTVYAGTGRASTYAYSSQSGVRFTYGGKYLEGSLAKETKLCLSSNDSEHAQSWYLESDNFKDYNAYLGERTNANRHLAYDATQKAIANYTAVGTVRFLPIDKECRYFPAPKVTVSTTKSTEVTLTFDALAGATGYKISTDGTTWNDASYTIADDVVTLTISELDANTDYTYYVRGIDSGSTLTDCAESAQVDFHTTNCDDVPYGISYTSDVNSIKLSWTMTSATATVQVFSDDTGTTQVGNHTDATSPYTITGLAKATTYYVKILADGLCPSELVEVSTERPQLDVVEWYENKIDVEINTDEKISVLLENQVTKGTGSGNVAEDLFFSKYFEGSGSLKLLGIFNGTNRDIDLTNYTLLRGNNGNGTSGTEFDLAQLGTIKQGQEIILFAEPTDIESPYECSQTFLADKKTKYGENENPRWILCDEVAHNGITFPKLNFSGDDPLILRKNGVNIDVWGVSGKTTVSKNTICTGRSDECWVAANVPNMDYGKTAEDFGGTIPDGVNIYDEYITAYTARVIMFRSNSVQSGANAVANNTSTFATFSTEWQVRQVCRDRDDGDLTCAAYTELGLFDYNGYYTTYDSLMVKEFDGNGRNPDGTITIEIPRLDTLSCRGLKIIASDESGHVLTAKEYRVPIIVSQSTTTADATVFHFSEDTCKTCDVVVRPKIKLEAKAKSAGGKVQFRNMMVYAKGNFEIPTGVDFMLDNLEMHAKNDTVAYALIDGSLTVSNKITHVKRINSVTMGGAGYHFALPYPCDGTSIRQYNGNSLGEYDVDWVVFYYAGDERAITGTWNEAGTGYNGKSYWRTFPTANFELQPNVAYIIATAGINAGYSLKSVYFPPKASEGYSEATYTESQDDSKTVAVTAYTGAAADKHANDRGWNFIGHPYISIFNHQTTGATGTNNDQVKMGYWEGTEYSETDKVYVNVPQNGVTSYHQDEAANLKMSPFLGYFVQVAGDADAELTFIKGARELMSAAPMMRAASVRDEHAEVALKLTAPSGAFDRTTILVDEAYTIDYEINRDLGKMARAAGLPRFYSISLEGLNEKMCYQALPSPVAENNVPLGFYAYEAGTYTIAIDSTRGDLSAVTAVALKVDGNVVHDLLAGPYTFSVARARTTNNASYSVSIQRKAQVTTDVNVVGNSEAVAPVVYTQGHRMHIQQLPIAGRLHIIDAVGRTLVDEQLDGCSERQYTLATDGVYVVRVATDSNVFIVKVAIR